MLNKLYRVWQYAWTPIVAVCAVSLLIALTIKCLSFETAVNKLTND